MMISAHLPMALALACAMMLLLRLTIRVYRLPVPPRWTKSDAAATAAGLLLTALSAISMALMVTSALEWGVTVWVALPAALAVHLAAYTVFAIVIPLASAPAVAGAATTA